MKSKILLTTHQFRFQNLMVSTRMRDRKNTNLPKRRILSPNTTKITNFLKSVAIEWKIRNNNISLFHMKIKASVTKSLLQGCGPCYLHSHIFFHTLSSSTAKQNVVTITVFLSKLDHQMLFNHIYQETISLWRLVSVWIITSTHCLKYTLC